MNSFLFPLLLGAPQGGSGASSGPAYMQFLPLVAIVGIFYFFVIRPQSKKQKDTQRMLDAIKKGDKVITIGGIHGVVQAVKDGSVIIKVDENTKVEFSRSAVSQVNPVKSEERKGGESKAQVEDKSGGATEEAK